MGMGHFFKALIVAGAALVAAQPACATWREASSAHFVIYSEQSARSLEEFATKLERYDKAIRVLRGLADEPVGKANRLTVYIVSDEAAVQKLYGRGGSSGNYGIAGFYIPRAGGSLAFVPRMSGGSEFDLDGQIVLLHEYAHHFMMQNYPGAYPPWFVEGYAEFHSTAKFDRDGSVGIGTPALHRAPSLLLGTSVPMEKLMALSSPKLGTAELDAVYARGWLLIHYLMFAQRDGQLRDYLARINKGEASLDAARAAFGDLKKLDRDLDGYIHQRLYYWHIPAAKLAVAPVAVREVTPAENAILPIRIRSQRGVDRKQAAALVPLARAVQARFPGDAAVENSLAECEYDARNYSEAEAAAGRALAADPKSVHALLYKARARMAVAESAKDFSPARWTDIRKTIASANRADPDDPSPFIFFYNSFA